MEREMMEKDVIRSESKEISVQGFVGSEPKTFKSGDTSSTRFRVAIKTETKETKWVTVSLRGEVGIKIAKDLIKGMPVFIKGKISEFKEDDKAPRSVIYANQIYRLQSFSA